MKLMYDTHYYIDINFFFNYISSSIYLVPFNREKNSCNLMAMSCKSSAKIPLIVIKLKLMYGE